MKRMVCMIVLVLIFLLSACSVISEPKPFPGLETEQSAGSTALTEASGAAQTGSEGETSAESMETEAAEPAQQEGLSVPSLSPEDVEKQLRLIEACSDLWKYEATETEICGYCVTDLDHNGRLELLMSSISTTGYISYTQCQEVNETCDALNDCIAEALKGDIQPMETLVCYTDGTTFCYAVSDKAQTIWDETVTTSLAMKLEKGKLTEEKLASVTNLSSLSSVQTVSAYADADGKPITQAEYDAIFDIRFSGWSKAEIRLGWIVGNYGSPSLEALRASYETFAGK